MQSMWTNCCRRCNEAGGDERHYGDDRRSPATHAARPADRRQPRRSQLDTLTNQASTGLIADTYAGLGTGAPVSLNLHPQIANLQTWQSNIDAATGRMSVAQSAMTQIQSIAANFYAQLEQPDRACNASAIDTIAALGARRAERRSADLLDTQDGGVYVFAGQDTANPPVPNPANASLHSGLLHADQLRPSASLRPTGPAATAAATLAIARSNAAGTSPFSPICRSRSPICSAPRWCSIGAASQRQADRPVGQRTTR